MLEVLHLRSLRGTTLFPCHERYAYALLLILHGMCSWYELMRYAHTVWQKEASYADRLEPSILPEIGRPTSNFPLPFKEVA